jgi:hypothetical protein
MGRLKLVAKNPDIGHLTQVRRDGKRAVHFRTRSRRDSNFYLVALGTGAERLLTAHNGPGRSTP